MYQELKFNIPELKGISLKTVEEHLKLYAGYVKNANAFVDKIEDIKKFSFEFNGMRNHEYYFLSLSDGAKSLPANSTLKTQIEKQWGSFDKWLETFKSLAMTRGVGWAMLYFDKEYKQLTHAWVDEQHLGQLNSCALVLGLDMWEHSYYFDYQTDKKKYVEAFFENLNWETIERFFVNASK